VLVVHHQYQVQILYSVQLYQLAVVRVAKDMVAQAVLVAVHL
jgi:hypothetical protein